MNPLNVIAVILLYFALIFAVGQLTVRKRKATSKSFFIGDRKSPWYLVAISMVGSSISGVTFISVPGMAAGTQFSYMQMVLGFTAGYFVVAYVLLPLYYRLDLLSIYSYLGSRFGGRAYMTGSAYFLISKLLGAGVRLYLTAMVLQLLIFDPLGIPFWLNAAVTMLVVWLYTFRGGVRTLVWTDTIQTVSMVTAVVLCIYYMCLAMGLDLHGLWDTVKGSPMSRTWFFDDPMDKRYFWKQFLSGVFTTVAMTGLDQDMMQKNLSCRSLRESQKNMISYGFAFIPVNLLFLSLGVLLYCYAARLGLTDPSGMLVGMKSDELFPYIATQGGLLPAAAGGIFVFGLVSASFSSAGSALTGLTATFTLDVLKKEKDGKARFWVHLGAAAVLAVLICLFSLLKNTRVIDAVYSIAGYTYGPLLGLYAFGLFTRLRPRDRAIPYICVLSPIICLILNSFSDVLLGGYRIGYELLLINAGITIAGLALASIRRS